MKQTIESIWQQGFIDKNDLVAPKINSLYNKKAQNIIDKLQRIFVMHNYFMMVAALLAWPICAFQGVPYFGAFTSVLFMSLVVLSKKKLKTLEKIDKNVSCYQYITSFDEWFKEWVADAAKIHTYLYSTFFLVMMMSFQASVSGQRRIDGFISDYPDSALVMGIPWFLVLGVLTITGLLAYFSEPISRIDRNIVCGRAIKKLDEIIADMEALRK